MTVMVGHVFGMLKAQEDIGIRGKSRMWRCACLCGGESIVSGSNLQNGHTRSCGCLKRRPSHNRTHGKGGSRLYRIWHAMGERCRRPQHPSYHHYGGRGISVCQEWAADFEAFERWSLAHGYDPGLTVDRIDNDGPYSPNNCRWTTWDVQMLNRRPRRDLKLTAAKADAIRKDTRLNREIAEAYGISKTMVGNVKRGANWAVERREYLITEPPPAVVTLGARGLQAGRGGR